MLENRNLILAKAHGEADPDRLDNLARHEVHLDRKLQDLRRGTMEG